MFFLANEQRSLLKPTLVNFDWLACQPLLPFLTQVLPAHLLYRSLLAHGFEDSLEIVEWIRGEQLQKVLDFDLWEKSFEFEVEDVSANKIFSWLQVWLSIGSEFAASRFLELEEETICLILSKLFEIIPEGVTNISEDIRENWWLTQDNKFFLRIRENAEETFEILKQFVDCLYAHDIRLAGSLFAYSCMLVRQETLEKGLHWRAIRISDQGFVSSEQARNVLAPKKIIDLKKSIHEAKLLSVAREESSSKFSHLFYAEQQHASEKIVFSPDEFDSVVKLLTSFGVEEGIQHVNLALGAEKTRSLVGNANVSLEQFYEDEDFIHEASENILAKVKNIILNLEFHSSKKEDANLLIEKAIIYIADKDKEKLYALKESIAYLANCVGTITNNYNSVDKSILITRGAINIGLDLCLKIPEEYGLKLKHTDSILNAVDCIHSLGVDFLFHLGWNLLFKIETNLVEKFILLDSQHSNFKGKLNTLRSIKLSDSSTTQVSLDKLVSTLRFADVGKWLDSCEQLFSNELFFTFKALLSQVPHYPMTLNESSNYVTTETKPFETLEDVNIVFRFIENLEENLCKN
ncbi:MAG: DUF6178 family protein [Bdellovibrionota bacterium]